MCAIKKTFSINQSNNQPINIPAKVGQEEGHIVWMVPLHQSHTFAHFLQGGLQKAMGSDLNQQGVARNLLKPFPEQDR
jgi:hypothetical protein